MRKSQTCNRQLKHGYTLLELMIVLAILVSVMGVAWPRIARRLQLIGPREAALQLSAALAEAREQSITSGQAWALRLERGASQYQIGPVADFRRRIQASTATATYDGNLNGQTVSGAIPQRDVVSIVDSIPTAVADPTTAAPMDVRADSIQQDELPVGVIFDDGFAHVASAANPIVTDVATSVFETKPIVTTALTPADNWKVAVIFQPDGRATESEILLKEQATKNKMRLRIRSFTGGITIDKLERNQPPSLGPDAISPDGQQTGQVPALSAGTPNPTPAKQPAAQARVPQ